MVKTLYSTLKKDKTQPNQAYLDTVLEASIRTDDSDLIYSALNDFLAIKR